jgi:hypothetical protein
MSCVRTFAIAVATAVLIGCGAAVFQDVVDPACLEGSWLPDANDTISVEGETFEAVLSHLLADVPMIDGDWAEDFGDTRFYAPAVLLGLGHQTDNACLLAFGQASLDGNRRLIRDTRCRLLPFWLQLPDLVMATFGLIEGYRYEPNADDVALIDSVLDRINRALEAFDFFPDALSDSLLSLYGSTAQTAALAALNLRYALQIGGARGNERLAFGLRVIEVLDERAYDPVRGVYRFSGSTEPLHLYPNAMMITANCLAYEATGSEEYLDRAASTFENIQGLRNSERGNYRSPYSADLMGATTTDYSTLSSQLYLITALCLLYENTGQVRYRDEAAHVLRFVCTHLRQGGQLVHHWIDGRPATRQDPEYYCSGCNFQAVYVMWYISNLPAPQTAD